MTSVWPALVAVALLAAVETREARTTVAAVASTGRGTAARAALLPGLALALSAGGAVGVLAVLPVGWAVRAGGIVVLVAGLQWLVWAARRELGTVPPRDEPSVYDAVRREGAAVGAALLRAGAETLVLATAVVALAGARPLWLPPLALLLVSAAIAPGLTGRRPGAGLAGRPFAPAVGAGVPGLRPVAGPAEYHSEAVPAARRSDVGPAPSRPLTVLPERPVKATIAVLLTAQGAAAVTSDAVGVPLATLLTLAGLLTLTASGRLPQVHVPHLRLPYARVPRRDLPHARVPRPPADPHGRPSRRRVLRDFVLGDDLTVWWAAAVLVLAPRLSSAGLAPIPAALLLTALLAALLGRTARRPRNDPSGGDR